MDSRGEEDDGKTIECIHDVYVYSIPLIYTICTVNIAKKYCFFIMFMLT